ncbi:MAG TPA: TlpA disulfide reductase family protein [Burkholderiales bacterium]|jgi:thiol-disulfide isomerase/thioredoxin|nr:TlpA disulfide reductase family protein [Burkholderiales bacterium]
MKRTGRNALLMVAAGLALAAGFWLNPWNRGGAPESGNVARLMAASLPDMEGKSQALAQWRGKLVVVNFWATWCPPCLEEIPGFVRMQEKFGNQGLQFVGIAIDNPAKVREFAAKYRMNYPVLIGEMDAIELGRMAGNERGGLPFTVIVDRKGRLVGTELGGLNEQKLTAIIQLAM